MQIESRTTIADLVGFLDDPVEYVRGVLTNMTAVKKQHGSAVVRVGTTGRGVAPHYRVEPDLPDIEQILEQDLSPYFIAFHGRNHEKLGWDHKQLQNDSWCMGHMTYSEVQTLLGSLRGYKGAKKS